MVLWDFGFIMLLLEVLVISPSIFIFLREFISNRLVVLIAFCIYAIACFYFYFLLASTGPDGNSIFGVFFVFVLFNFIFLLIGLIDSLSNTVKKRSILMILPGMAISLFLFLVLI
jgi:hypothetical protein